MGSGRKLNKQKPTAQLRSRQTRSTKGRLLSDPAHNTQLLTEQLRSLGLYAANTLGDGNCLFRALSDQLYGSESRHHQLRKEICDWIHKHKTRYEPFVEDDRGIDVHLRCMRENGTYGGHLELSAFAHMTHRNVKVIQPGLVYVIEWAGGGEPSSPDRSTNSSMHISDDEDDDEEHDDPALNDRERRRLRRDKKRAHNEKERAGVASSSSQQLQSNDDVEADDSDFSGTIYVAYHDWEHFSSIRNLRGPHTGLPNVQETPAHPSSSSSYPMPSSPVMPKRKATLTKTTLPKVKLKLSSASASASASSSKAHLPLPLSAAPAHDPTRLDPSLIALPESRASTPATNATGSSSLSSLSSPSPPPQIGRSGLSAVPPHMGVENSSLALGRVHRSPKRSRSASVGASSEASEGSDAKRRRRRRRRPVSPSPRSTGKMDVDVDQDQDFDDDDADEDEDGDEEGEGNADDEDTPGLSAPGSEESSSFSSSISSAASSPDPEPPTPKPLTRRQRKALGLPKPRVALGGGAGKIVIPGGRYKRAGGVGVKDAGEEEAEEEWRRNGAGRVDVRGFRELKI